MFLTFVTSILSEKFSWSKFPPSLPLLHAKTGCLVAGFNSRKLGQQCPELPHKTCNLRSTSLFSQFFANGFYVYKISASQLVDIVKVQGNVVDISKLPRC